MGGRQGHSPFPPSPRNNKPESSLFNILYNYIWKRVRIKREQPYGKCHRKTPLHFPRLEHPDNPGRKLLLFCVYKALRCTDVSPRRGGRATAGKSIESSIPTVTKRGGRTMNRWRDRRDPSVAGSRRGRNRSGTIYLCAIKIHITGSLTIFDAQFRGFFLFDPSKRTRGGMSPGGCKK